MRTFSAPTAQAAMALVRAEMGPEAVIISVEEAQGGRGVMVRAAVEAFGAPVAIDPLDDLRQPLAMESEIERQLKASLRTGPRAEAPAPPPVQQPGADANQVYGDVLAALMAHRIDDVVADTIAKAAAVSGLGTAAAGLAHAIDSQFVLSPLPIAPPRPIMLLGGPGAGKTTFVARLALRAAMDETPSLMVSTDADKAGAVAQLETYAKLIKVKALAARNADELKKAIAAAESGMPVFIDTPALNLFDDLEVDERRDLIKSAGAEAVAVLPAGLDAEEARDAAQVYAALGVHRLIWARIDTARRLGSLVMATRTQGLALAHYTTSPFLAQGLEAPDALHLATLLLQFPDSRGTSKRARSAA